MSLGLTLAMRGVTLLGVLFVVLVLVVITLGATGFSDNVLESIVNEELRGIRQGLTRTILDPEQLQRVMEAQRADREEFYGLDQAWYTRLPDMVRLGLWPGPARLSRFRFSQPTCRTLMPSHFTWRTTPKCWSRSPEASRKVACSGVGDHQPGSSPPWPPRGSGSSSGRHGWGKSGTVDPAAWSLASISGPFARAGPRFTWMRLRSQDRRPRRSRHASFRAA